MLMTKIHDMSLLAAQHWIFFTFFWQELDEKGEERKKMNAKKVMEKEYAQRERGDDLELARRLERNLKPGQTKIK